MKKIILIVLVLLVAAPVIFTLGFTKNHKEVSLKRSVEVNASKEQVFAYISHTENKAKWLGDLTKKIERSSTGTDATVGFVRSWTIQNPPEKGSETITKIVDGTSIETQVKNNVNGAQTDAVQILSCEPIDASHTTIIWQTTSNIPLGFWQRMLLGFSEKLAKATDNQQAYDDGLESGLEKSGAYKTMDESLQKLKNNIEEEAK